MSDKMIEELKEVCDHWSVRNEWGVPVVPVHLIKEIIARLMAEQEPLCKVDPSFLCDELKAEKEEPKDCGFTLATCPYERCSGITMRKEEPLAVLADRKGWWVSRAKHFEDRWVLNFDCETLDIWTKCEDLAKPIVSKTYPEAEAAARKFLEGLEDKGGKI